MTPVLVTGGSGQVGHALSALNWPGDIRVLAPTRAELDLQSPDSIRAWLAAHRPALVINAAAYTAVDRAEDEVAAAFAANAMGPAVLAEETRAAGIPLVHVSTDYVFDGMAPGFYREDAPVAPIGVYGASKLAGELAVRTGNPAHVILRTAWVVSDHGANFVKTMLRVGAQRPELRVVDDQRGCPTSAADIAAALRGIALRLLHGGDAPFGTVHFVNAGEASWCELARFVFQTAAPLGGPSPQVTAIATADYPTRARRPANSRLATDRIAREYGITPRPWPEAIGEIVTALARQGFGEAA